jgi:hypothetical protein
MPEPYYSYAKLRVDRKIWNEIQVNALVSAGKITQSEADEIIGV